MPVAAPEWSQFAVGSPSTRDNWTNPDCQPLTTVSHVAHVEAASRIIADGKLRAALIFDKSRLNAARILVTWLSPNYWAYGFRYGNVRFTFPWEPLITNMRFYWVESIAYGVAACRILVTERDYGNSLLTYDPSRRDGPWWHDVASGKHYWNGQHCLEVMVERDIQVSEHERLDFVDHHGQYCCLDGPCAGMGQLGQVGGAQLVGRLLDMGLSARHLRIDPFTLKGVFWQLLREMPRGGCTGSAKCGDPSSVSLARAAAGAYGRGAALDVANLCRLFASTEDLDDALAQAVAVAFGVGNHRDLFVSHAPGL